MNFPQDQELNGHLDLQSHRTLGDYTLTHWGASALKNGPAKPNLDWTMRLTISNRAGSTRALQRPWRPRTYLCPRKQAETWILWGQCPSGSSQHLLAPTRSFVDDRMEPFPLRTGVCLRTTKGKQRREPRNSCICWV